MEKIKNFGFVNPIIQPEEWIGGANLPLTEINPSGDWRPYLPEREIQNIYTETCNCTAFGTLNAVECIMKLKYKLGVNYSDRFLGIIAGTYPPGNSPHTVAEYARKYGFVPEVTLPFTADLDTVSKYFSPKPVPNWILKIGETWLGKYAFKHEWINNQTHEQLKQQLKYSPIGVAVVAWFLNEKGEYYYPNEYSGQENHWTLLVAFDEDRPVIFDSYDNTLKILTKNYPLSLAKKYAIETQIPEDKVAGIMALWKKIQDIWEILKK